jgi:hypothetical protein
MAGRTFVTVADELIEYADAVADHLETLGFRVRVEHREIGYPYVPTLCCKRGVTTLLVEVRGRIALEVMGEWSRYGRSCTRDTRVALAVPGVADRPAALEEGLRGLGVGLFVATGTTVMEAVAPHDLAINVSLPDLAGLPPRIRKLLGPSYEQFNRSNWREGFEDACQALEQEARRHLKAGWTKRRIVVLTPTGKISKLTVARINRLPMGELAKAFQSIQSPSHAETVIGDVLSLLNKDRIGVVHRRRTARAEERLRRNVGQHMWRVVDGLKALLNAR